MKKALSHSLKINQLNESSQLMIPQINSKSQKTKTEHVLRLK
jgi:hypothetical protein